MAKHIYLLYGCDAHKCKNSMRLLLATTKEQRLRKGVVQQIEKGDMEYGSYRSDLKEMPLLDLNNCLEYGYIDAVVDGELQ